MNASVSSTAHEANNQPSQTPWNTTDTDEAVASAPPHSVVLRFAVLNVIAFALLAAAWANGLVDKVMAADATRLSLLILAVFLGGLALCAWRVNQVSRDITALEPTGRSPGTLPHYYLNRLAHAKERDQGAISGSMRLELTQRIVLVRYIANALVLLGLIGTVVGFIIALSAIDPDGATDVNAIAPMVSNLIAGMSTALYTTLVGSVLNIWLMANYQILAHGTVRLISGLLTLPQPDAVDANA